MKVIYASKKMEQQCTDLKAAKKLFSGDKSLAMSLLARVNALIQAETIHDIIVQKQFHFHNLYNVGRKNYEGYFAIDVKTRREQWRIILELLDDDEKPFDPPNIDEISRKVRIVEIVEVSKHYE